MIVVRRVLVTGAALVAAAGCLGRRGAATDGAAVDARLTLYRDDTLIEERLTIAVDASGHGAVPLPGARPPWSPASSGSLAHGWCRSLRRR